MHPADHRGPRFDASLRILLLTPRLWYPANTGGRIRSSQLFERLARQHAITAICFQAADDGDAQVERMRGWCSELEVVPWRDTSKSSPRFYAEAAASLLGPLPYTIAKYRDSVLSARVAARLASNRYDLLICDFLQPAVNCLNLGFRPRILFQHNVEATIRERQAAGTRPAWLRLCAYRDLAKLRDYEGRIARAFDCCVTVSEAERRTMLSEYGVREAVAIPAAVDTSYFEPAEEKVESPNELLFVGSMDWHPNQDAARHFVREIFPRIRQTVPATLTIAGRHPPDFIRRLAGVPGVFVVGTVEDVRPYFARAQVCVVPLRVGGGTRIKIFEAMAMGKAVVSTQVGAEGLPVSDGIDIALADGPEAFAAAVVRLLLDADARRRLAKAGRRLAERHTWEAAAERLSEICMRVVRDHRGSHDPFTSYAHRRHTASHPGR